jgi:hypothetical protein
MTGSTARYCNEASGAAAFATVMEYGIMYGQHIGPRLKKAAAKKGTVIAKGRASWGPGAPKRTPSSSSRPITKKARLQDCVVQSN